MDTLYTSLNSNDVDVNLANIIAMNTFDIFGDDSENYDFDYEPNEFYYELKGCTYTFLT